MTSKMTSNKEIPVQRWLKVFIANVKVVVGVGRTGIGIGTTAMLIQEFRVIVLTGILRIRTAVKQYTG